MADTSTNAIHTGVESTFGAAVALTRSYKAEADTWAIEPIEISIEEIKAGQSVVDAGDELSIPNGGIGEISSAFYDSGMGRLLKATFGDSSISTTDQHFELDETSSDDSLTVQVVRSQADAGAPVAYTYAGCVISGCEFSFSTGDVLKSKFDFTWETVTTATAAATPAYPASQVPWHFRQGTITFDGTELAVRDFTLTVDNAMQPTDYIRTGARLKPQRKGPAMITGSLALDATAAANDLYDAWVANETLNDLQLQVVNGAHEFIALIPAFKCSSANPEMSRNEFTSIPVEFKAVTPASGNPLILDYNTSDTAY